jgi:hypothetical protein
MNSTTNIGILMALLVAAGCSSSSNGATGSSSSGGGTPDSGATSDDASEGDDADAGGGWSIPAGYPAGPYGVKVNDTLDPTLNWQGFAPGATTPSTVRITDLYDPDGSKKINAIIIDSAGQWCVACQGIAMEIPTWLSSKGDNYTGLGVQILNLVIQNNDYEPATITTAQQWRTLFSLTSIYVTADPSDTFPTDELPYELLVDPRTMKVVHNLSDDTDQNNDGSDPAVVTLAKTNQKTDQ